MQKLGRVGWVGNIIFFTYWADGLTLIALVENM